MRNLGGALLSMVAYAQPMGCNSGDAMTTVRREIVLPVERERAWELLTEPAELEGWLADEVEFEPEEGAPLRAAWEDGEERAGVVEEVEPERRIRFVWTGAREAPQAARARAGAGARARRLRGRVDARGRRRRHPPPGDRAPAGRLRPGGDGELRAAYERPGPPRGCLPGVSTGAGSMGQGASGAGAGAGQLGGGAVFAALADPTRREVMAALAREPSLTASRLAGDLPVTRQAI